MRQLVRLVEHSNRLQYNDSNHTYNLDGKSLISISTFVSKFYPKFDSQFHAKRIAEKDGKTVEQVLKEWKIKADKSTIHRGVPYHNYVENRIKGYVVSPPDKSVVSQTSRIMEWMSNLNITPLFCELKTYNLELGIAGTMDLLAYNKETNKLLIIDWKTNKEIIRDNPYNKFMFPPFDEYADNNFNHYNLQINFYRYCLEKVLGEIFEEGYIVHLDHSGSVSFYQTTDLRPKIAEIPNFLPI